MLQKEDLSYVPKIIKTELISKHYNNSPAGFLGIEKSRKVATQKYY